MAKPRGLTVYDVPHAKRDEPIMEEHFEALSAVSDWWLVMPFYDSTLPDNGQNGYKVNVSKRDSSGIQQSADTRGETVVEAIHKALDIAAKWRD